MVKFLFTSERLSIQVHPDDEAARGAGFPRGKEECWLILDAQPGAELGVSLNRQSSREELQAAALDGSIVHMIDWRPSHPDRKSDVEGKSVSVRVDLGGRRTI